MTDDDLSPTGPADGSGRAEPDESGAREQVPETPGGAAAPDITSNGSDTGAEAPSLAAAIEAVLMVVDEPVTDGVLAQILERPREEVLDTLRSLAEDYRASGKGFELRDVAGGWRFYSAPSCAPYVERFVRDGQQARLTQAALETLAVVAYRQPVSRARVSAVRGVNVEAVMRTLLARGLVEEAGTEPESGAILYRTTSYFLERLGIASLDNLPELAPFLPDLESLEAEHA